MMEVWHGAIAQLGEHLLCTQGVIGSIPFSSTNQMAKVSGDALRGVFEKMGFNPAFPRHFENAVL